MSDDVIEQCKNMAAMFIDESVQSEVVVFFAAPLGDGEGCKRFVGGAADVSVAFGVFIERLYRDGGKLIIANMRRVGESETFSINGAEFEAKAFGAA